MEFEIDINKAVLHILDNNMDIPVLSGSQLDIDSETEEFLKKHIGKILSDNNLKEGIFNKGDNNIFLLCERLMNDREVFLEASLEISNSLFGIMKKHIDISPADLVCCLFECNKHSYLGIMKLNYKTGFTHHVYQTGQGNTNGLIRYMTLLPSDSQRVEECAIISLENYGIKLIEREYEINGEKDVYLSKKFLDCDTKMSNNEKLKIINKTAQKINKKYYDEDMEKVAKLKKVVTESLENEGNLSIGNLAKEVFTSNVEVQKEYVEEIQKAGIIESDVKIPEKLIEKKFKTHKIKTDTGIEINFPVDVFEDKGKIEFMNNPDGTVSIIIKNVSKITNK